MKIDFLTREDLDKVDAKLNELLQLLRASKSYGGTSVYTTQQLAKKLNVSTKTIQNWREQKLIDFSQVNNKIFYTEDSVDQFLAIHSIKRRSISAFLTSSNKKS